MNALALQTPSPRKKTEMPSARYASRAISIELSTGNLGDDSDNNGLCWKLVNRHVVPAMVD